MEEVALSVDDLCSAGYIPRCPICFVSTSLCSLGVVYWVWVPFLLFLCDVASVLCTCILVYFVYMYN